MKNIGLKITLERIIQGVRENGIQPHRRLGMSLAMLVVFAVSILAGPLETFMSSKGIDPGSTSVLILDLGTGKTIASSNASTPLVPASIMKAVTIGALLNETGPSYTYQTPVEISGTLENGVLDGNIYVKGSGDPSLNSRYVAHNVDFCDEIAAYLKKAGVERVKGKVYVDESIWCGPAVCPSWAQGDLSKNYGTGQHGLNFSDNAVGKSSIANPAGAFLQALKRRLTSKGITLQNGTASDSNRRLLVNHKSVAIDEIMRSCMMRSDNQYAEAMLRTLAVAKGKIGSVADGAQASTDFWKSKKVPMDGVRIVDGSGLSRSNRLTANFMASALQSMANNPYYASFFPLAGQEGTLKGFLVGTPLEGYVAMKTGSMNGIQCYAGYVLDDDYAPTHVVVFMMNNLVSRDRARKDAQKLLLSLFAPQFNENEIVPDETQPEE